MEKYNFMRIKYAALTIHCHEKKNCATHFIKIVWYIYVGGYFVDDSMIWLWFGNVREEENFVMFSNERLGKTKDMTERAGVSEKIRKGVGPRGW